MAISSLAIWKELNWGCCYSDDVITEEALVVFTAGSIVVFSFMILLYEMQGYTQLWYNTNNEMYTLTIYNYYKVNNYINY